MLYKLPAQIYSYLGNIKKRAKIVHYYGCSVMECSFILNYAVINVNFEFYSLWSALAFYLQVL